jgi:hypothetical protein
VTCCGCQRSGKTDRLPHGWKRHQESVYCEHCWQERYVLRSVVLPVVEPVGEVWQAFREVLRESWAQATAAANWMMTELYARDVRRNGEGKMPRMARVYLYPEVRRRFPDLASQTVVSLENSVQAAYRAARYEVVWVAAASLPSYRYPVPLPVHNQSWETMLSQERPVVRVRLGQRWWVLRLKGGPRFRRQTEAYRQMVSGLAIRGELALYRVRAQEGKLADRPNSDQTVKYAVMCKMVAWFPREHRLEIPQEKSILQVRTAKDMLLVALNPKGEILWRYHGDHLRRRVAEHRKRLQSFADDQKAEQRPHPSFADRRTAAVVKYRNRMRSGIQEIAAQLAGYAQRGRFTGIEYDDSNTHFCPEFQFLALREQIRAKCEALGLEFRHSGQMISHPGNADSGPPVGPARTTADTLADLATRGRL